MTQEPEDHELEEYLNPAWTKSVGAESTAPGKWQENWGKHWYKKGYAPEEENTLPNLGILKWFKF